MIAASGLGCSQQKRIDKVRIFLLSIDKTPRTNVSITLGSKSNTEVVGRLLWE